MGELYVALIHYPVYNKTGRVVTTSITPLDLHDFARSCVTFGVRRCYIVNPLPQQRQMARRIVAYWRSGHGGEYNKTRQEAFGVVSIVATLDEAEQEIAQRRPAPLLVGTSARERGTTPYETLAERIPGDSRDYLLLFGTGWGMTDELLGRCDCVLEPIRGQGAYNHLSVRAALAIILDRLRGSGRKREDVQAASAAAAENAQP